MSKSLPFVKVKDASRRPIMGLWARGQKYYARLSFNGKEKRYTLKATMGDVDAAKKEIAAMRKDGPPVELRRWGFSDVAKDYLDTRAKEKGGEAKVKNLRASANVLTRYFGNRLVSTITAAEIVKYRALRRAGGVAGRAKGISERSANIELMLLRVIFRFAKLNGALREMPTDGIKLLRHKTFKTRFIGLQEVERIAEWVRKNYRGGDRTADAILFLAYSGARLTAGMNVRWEDVSFETGKLMIRLNKGDESYFVDLNPDLRNLLMRLRVKRGGKCSGLIFPARRNPSQDDDKPMRGVRHGLSAALKALGLPRFSAHGLRHHFASRCMMAGINAKMIAEWMGHHDGGVLVAKTYGHLAPGHGTEAAKLLGRPAEPTPPPETGGDVVAIAA